MLYLKSYTAAEELPDSIYCLNFSIQLRFNPRLNIWITKKKPGWKSCGKGPKVHSLLPQQDRRSRVFSRIWKWLSYINIGNVSVGNIREVQLIRLVEIQLRSRTILRRSGHLRTVLLLSPESELNLETKVLFLRPVYLEQTQRAALRDVHI